VTARSAIGAFVRRDARVAWSYRLPLLFAEVVSALFLLITFVYVGRLVGPGQFPGGYFSFAAAGIALTTFLQTGVATLASNFRQEQVQGTLEATLSVGLPVRTVAAGVAAYPMAFAAARAAVYVGLAAVLGARAPGGNWGLALYAVVAGSIAFAGLGLVAAALVVLFRQAQSAAAFLVTLLALAAGTLFPPELLPGWAEGLSELSPFTHSLRLVRRALLEGDSWSASVGDASVLAALAAASAVAGVAALAWSIRRAMRTGAIADY
jgi:ABC-2 type transport system permease protein